MSSATRARSHGLSTSSQKVSGSRSGGTRAGEPGTHVDSLPRTPAATLSRTACSTKAWTSRPAAAHSSGTGTAMSEASGVGSVMARSVLVRGGPAASRQPRGDQGRVSRRGPTDHLGRLLGRLHRPGRLEAALWRVKGWEVVCLAERRDSDALGFLEGGSAEAKRRRWISRSTRREWTKFGLGRTRYSIVRPMSRMDLHPAHTTATGVRPSSVRSAETSSEFSPSR